MEFWGVEVKAGEPVEVDPEEFDAYIHLSQAALGETKKDKGAEPVVLYLKFDEKKFVLGTLSKDNFPQISFDLVLEKKFELSHNSKNGSVFFIGYKAEIPAEEGDDFDDISDSEEDVDLPVMAKANGKPDAKAALAKVAAPKKSDANANVSKKKGKVDMENDSDDDSEDDDDDDGDDNDEGSDEDMLIADGDSDDESDDDDDDDEDDDEETPKKETPKKADLSKKRPNDSAAKTPVSAKKAKSGTPDKNDAKKGGHTATPFPKKGGKTPNSEAKEPKSGGHLSCKSCSKTFNSESGLQQHNKAKHGQ